MSDWQYYPPDSRMLVCSVCGRRALYGRPTNDDLLLGLCARHAGGLYSLMKERERLLLDAQSRALQEGR